MCIRDRCGCCEESWNVGSRFCEFDAERHSGSGTIREWSKMKAFLRKQKVQVASELYAAVKRALKR